MFRCNVGNHSALTKNNALAFNESFSNEPEIAEKIPILRVYRISDRRYSERTVYESYKAVNLKEMLKYMDFVLSLRSILPNQIHPLKAIPLCRNDLDSAQPQEKAHIDLSTDRILADPRLSKEIKTYYNMEAKVNLPEQIGNCA